MEDTDFVVVGGGVYGAALAYELVKSGSSVTLLEAGHLAERASGGPGKRGVRATLRNSRELPLVRESLAMWPTLAKELGAETGFERLGGLTLVSSMPQLGEIGLARANAHQNLQSAHGIDTELLDQAELRSIEPGISPAEFSALYCADEGIADQRKTTHAYAAAAQRLGAVIHEDSWVDRVGATPHPWAQVRDGQRFEARRAVIVAANHGTNALLERSEQALLPVWTMVPQVLMYRAKGGYQPRHLIGHLQQNLAVKPLSDGVTMISGGMRGKWDAAAGTGSPVATMIDESLRVARASLPALGDGELLDAQASLPETYTPDGLPFIDFIDDELKVLVATGWHGHGFAIAPSLARHLADWLSTGQKPTVLAPFKISRS